MIFSCFFLIFASALIAASPIPSVSALEVRNDPPRPHIRLVFKVPESQIRRRLTPTLPATESLENVVKASFPPGSEIFKYFVVYTGLKLQVTFDTDICIIEMSSKSLKIVGIPLKNIHHDVPNQRLTFTFPPGASMAILGSAEDVEHVAQSVYGKTLQDFVLRLKTYIATDANREILPDGGTGDSVSGTYRKGHDEVYVEPNGDFKLSRQGDFVIIPYSTIQKSVIFRGTQARYNAAIAGSRIM